MGRSASLRPEIEAAVSGALARGEWDDATFDAFKIVEAALQTQVGRVDLFGARLITYAFEEPAAAPRVRIVGTERENHQLARLVGGAIGFLKGDRSHKMKPSAPCPDEDVCSRILAFASYLLDLLDLDENAAPAIQAVRAESSESVELDVLRASRDAIVFGNGTQLTVISRDASLIRVGLPGGQKRVDLCVMDGRRRSPLFEFESQATPRDANFNLVEDGDLPLYASAAGDGIRAERGVRLQSYEGGRRFVRYFPVRRKFVAGDYVDWTWDMGGSVGESWTRGPKGVLAYAWTSSAFFDGRRLGHNGTPRTAAIEIRPQSVRIRPREKTPLRVIAFVVDGPACWREDVTERAELESLDTSVAKVDPATRTLSSGAGGSTKLRARYGGRFDQVAVNVSALTAATVVEHLGGIRRIVNIVPHRDGVLIAHQQDHLLLLRPDLGIERIAFVPMPETAATGLDFMTSDPAGNIYVRTIWNGELLKLTYESNFASSIRVASAPSRTTFMSMTWSVASPELIVADSERGLWRWHEGMAGPEFWMRLPMRVAGLHATSEWLLIVPAVAPFGYARLSWDGTCLEAIVPESDLKYAPSAILPRADDVLVTDFHAGRVYSIRQGALQNLADGFVNPTALATDPHGGVLVANFGGDSIARIVP